MTLVCPCSKVSSWHAKRWTKTRLPRNPVRRQGERPSPTDFALHCNEERPGRRRAPVASFDGPPTRLSQPEDGLIEPRLLSSARILML
ncbi:unnamed protein product [Jaminaea pallidilutea]